MKLQVFCNLQIKKTLEPHLFQLGGVASRMVQLKAIAVVFAILLTTWEINVTV